jgi:tRNA/rRNA methyltransferase
MSSSGRVLSSRIPAIPETSAPLRGRMKTMGLSRLVLVNPREFPHPQADAMAAGAVDVLANAEVVAIQSECGPCRVRCLPWHSRLVDVNWRHRRCGRVMLLPKWRVLPPGGDVALVFGNETSGLSNEELALCGRWATVPVDPAFSSLNLAAAVQLMSYELRLAALDPGAPPPISGAGMAASVTRMSTGLIEHIERAAIGSGFLDPDAVPGV